MEEYENTARATSISRSRGDADVAIDFENQIFGFPNFQISRNDVVSYIFESSAYSIVSLHEPLGKIDDAGKLVRGGSFFSTDYLIVHRAKSEELLDDYAYRFICDVARPTDCIFESSDFLTQICITHTLHRLRQYRTSFEPWNDVRRRRAEKLRVLESKFLELFQPRIQEGAQIAQSIFGGRIDYSDIYSRAFSLTASLALGDEKRVIRDVLRSDDKEGSQRMINREMRVHPFSSKGGKKTDIKRTEEENKSFLTKLILEKVAENNPISETLLMLNLEPDAHSSWFTGALNNNSERVYFPNNNVSVLQFVFGKHGPHRSNLMRYLRDSFRTEINRQKNNDVFSEELHFQSFETSPRRWKKNDLSGKYTQDQISHFLVEAKKLFQKAPRAYEAYEAWLRGSLNFSSSRDRRRLYRAMQKIRKLSQNLPHS